MSIVRMATLPNNVLPAEGIRGRVRGPGEAARVRRPHRSRHSAPAWRQTLLADAYPAIGLALIVGYLLWAFVFGEGTVTWSGGLTPAE